MKLADLIQTGAYILVVVWWAWGLIGGPGAPDPDHAVYYLYAVTFGVVVYQYFWGPRRRHPVFLWYFFPTAGAIGGCYLWAHFQPDFWNSPRAAWVAFPLTAALWVYLFCVHLHFRPKRGDSQ